MFVSFTKTLKKMSGFRLGFGVRVNKRNAPLWCFAMLFAGMFYLMWYMIIGAGWCRKRRSNRRMNEPNKKNPPCKARKPARGIVLYAAEG